MSTAVNQLAEAPTEGEIVSMRIFNAPRHTIFRAFIDPDRLARWWGPKGFTNTFHEFNPQAGGAWRFVMHGPDGTDYLMEKEFVEVVPSERIVLQHIQEQHQFQMSIAFADESDGTRVIWRMRFESAEEAERVREFVTAANEENFDRLGLLLSAEA